jgi:hypothetical protein
VCHDVLWWAMQVGIVTLMTPREVAAEAGVALAEVAVTDERVGAVVVTGSELRCGPSVWRGLVAAGLSAPIGAREFPARSN